MYSHAASAPPDQSCAPRAASHALPALPRRSRSPPPPTMATLFEENLYKETTQTLVKETARINADLV